MQRIIAIICALMISCLPVQADLIKQSAAYNRTVLMTDASNHISGKTGLTLVVKIAKVGGSYTTITPAVTEQSGGTGRYSIALSASDTNMLGALDLQVTAAGADPTDSHDQVVAFDPGDAMAMGLGALPNATAGTSGGVPIGDAAGRVALQPNDHTLIQGDALSALASLGINVTWTARLDTPISGVKAKTDLLPAQPASKSDVHVTILSPH